MLKSRIRNLFAIGKNSVHINDTYAETILLIKTLLNGNSRHWLNFKNITRYPIFEEKFSIWRLFLSHLDKKFREMLCVDGSAVLAAYGIREIGDFYFISILNLKNIIGYASLNIECNNLKRFELDVDVENIILSPGNNFYYFGYKFISVQKLIEIKRSRVSAGYIIYIRLYEELIVDDANNKSLFKKIIFKLSCGYMLFVVKKKLLRARSQCRFFVE